jgi:RimJ/RimL family protein N-acetyltransferase
MGAGDATPETPRLVAPAVAFHASFLAALAEYQAEGRHLELDPARMADAAEFGRYAAALRAGVTDPQAPDRYVWSTFGVWPADQAPETYVPQTVLWWAAGHEYLGRLNIRHELSEWLLRGGGNIGYEVRPGTRRQGHATAMLAAALPLAAALGIDPVRLDCEVDNVASRRVIEKNGGRLEREEEGSFFFLLPTR